MASSIRLRPGVRLGPYRIEAVAGEGAMGRVYRATDLRLGRPVALKVLPEEFTNQRERMARLAQEAKAASSLNHPNIVTVYEVGEQLVMTSGQHRIADLTDPNARVVPFIAMEFVDGQSLRELLGGGPLSEKKSMDFAVQAAEALMRAHEAGIVHRDLKPDNLMIRTDGYLKILDFGLARVTPSATEVSKADTYDGGYFVVGTASYMSPEQARGKPLDGRSDIFSLGVVLYEALSGRSPFSGESAVDTLSAVLHQDPLPLAEVAPNVSRDLARAVERCLAKDPEERYQSMRDLSLELKSLRRDFESGLISSRSRVLAETAPSRRVRNLLRVAAAALLAAVPVALVLGSKMARPPVSVSRLTSSGRAFSPAISPDGTVAAYLEEGDPRRLLLRHIGSNTALAIDTGGISPAFPEFSSDGSSIYFSAMAPDGSASLFRAATLGGAPQRLGAGYRPIPSPDGKRLAFLCDRPGPHPFFELCVSGGNGDQVRCANAGPPPPDAFAYTWKADSRSLRVVRWTPDGVSLLGTFDPAEPSIAYSSRDADRLDFMVSGFRIDVFRGDLYLTGSKIFNRGGNLRRRAGRAVERVTTGLSDFRGLSIDASGQTALTADFRESSNIYALRLSGDPVGDAGRAQILTAENEGDYRPVWSPDGRRIAFISTRTGHRSVWMMNSDGSGARELTPGSEDYGWPAWSPDGRFLSFSGTRAGNHELYLEDGGGGELRRLTSSKNFNGQAWWAPDGRWLIYESADDAGNPLLKKISSTGGAPEVFANADLEFPSISPDGALLAATTEPASREEIPVRVLRLSDKKVIFETRIALPSHLMTWTPDARALVAVLPDGPATENVFRIPIDGGAPIRLTQFPPRWQLSGCALDASGEALLVTRQRNNSDIVVIAPLRGPSLGELLGFSRAPAHARDN